MGRSTAQEEEEEEEDGTTVNHYELIILLVIISIITSCAEYLLWPKWRSVQQVGWSKLAATRGL